MEERQYWDPEIETMPREKLRELQERKFLRTVTYAYAHSRLYKKMYDQAGIDVSKIERLDDIKKLPFITKDMIRADTAETGDPFGGLLCVPVERLHFLPSSSGTTGEVTFCSSGTMYDWDRRTEMVARFFGQAGFRLGMRYYGMEWMTYWYYTEAVMKGIERMGLSGIGTGIDVAAAATDPPKTVDLLGSILKWYKPDCGILGGPQHLAMITGLDKMGLDPKKEVGAERGQKLILDGFSEQAGITYIEKRLGDTLLPFNFQNDIMMVIGPCIEDRMSGVHLSEDIFYAEILEPETGEVLGPGKLGELVLTTLDAEGFPYIRWRTEDLYSINPEPCKCGRTFTRLIYQGREAFYVRVKGKRIYPDRDVAPIVRSFPELAGEEFTLVKSGPDMDSLTVMVTMERVSEPKELAREVGQKLSAELDRDIKVEPCKLTDIPRVGWKVIRIKEVK